jgi:hypothetical protein
MVYVIFKILIGLLNHFVKPFDFDFIVSIVKSEGEFLAFYEALFT